MIVFYQQVSVVMMNILKKLWLAVCTSSAYLVYL